MPPVMPPSGMVTTSMKLWAMVAAATSRSPWPAPPYFCNRELRAMIITLSKAMMMKGVKPVAITRPMMRAL